MEQDQSKFYFWLFMFSYIAVAAFQIGWSGISDASSPGDGFVVDGYNSIEQRELPAE